MALVTAFFKVVIMGILWLFSVFSIFIAYIFMGIMEGCIKTNGKDVHEWTYSGPCKWLEKLVK